MKKVKVQPWNRLASIIPSFDPGAGDLVHGDLKATAIVTMLSILRKARLKDKEMRILMLYVNQNEVR